MKKALLFGAVVVGIVGYCFTKRNKKEQSNIDWNQKRCKEGMFFTENYDEKNNQNEIVHMFGYTFVTGL